MFAIISPFSKTFDEIGLFYFVPAFLEGKLKEAMIVEIPLKDNIEIGVVLKIGTVEILGLKIDEAKIKSLIDIKNDNIFISGYRLELVNFIANYYFTAIHNSLQLFFPKNLREKIEKNKIPPFIEEGNNNIKKYTFNHTKKLSETQKKAYNNIINSKNNKILLHGITGSGKTEIYIKLIKAYLDKQQQSLLLIPEIILTNQLAGRLEQVFGKDIIVLNSSISEAKKTKYWLDINSGIIKIIIGTRSALFYPYNNLGLIIIDEEHDQSYISDKSPRYNAIEIAEKITELNGNKLLLGSGTPSIKSMYKAVRGEYELVSLFEKYK